MKTRHFELSYVLLSQFCKKQELSDEKSSGRHPFEISVEGQNIVKFGLFTFNELSRIMGIKKRY